MSLRAWNNTRIEWYLNRDWSDRIPGSPNIEEPMQARKLESRVILRAIAYDSVDANRQAKEGDEEAIRYTLSERMMEHMIYVFMAQNHPALDRHFKEWFLKDNVTGPVIEIERYEKMAKDGAPLAWAIAERGRWWIERVLDELDSRNFRLFVHKDHRAASLREARHQQEYDVKAIRDAGIRGRFATLKEETKWSDAEIKDRIMSDYGVGKSTYYAALKEGKEEDSGAEESGEGAA